MPKSPNQKLKLLYLMEILLQQTDERHPMTVPEMISELARHGVAAERKSIYNAVSYTHLTLPTKLEV